MSIEAPIQQYTGYQINRAILLDQVLKDVKNSKKALSRSHGMSFEVDFKDLDDKEQTIRIDNNFIHGLSLIAFGLWEDLINDNEAETAEDILVANCGPKYARRKK